ncbi:MAG: hypothetical protein ACREDJ_04660 [Methylocella sp.]
MQQRQELLQKWDERVARLHPRMEITGEVLTLGAGTVLAAMARDGRGAPRIAQDDEPRAMALLATAYERPVGAYVLGRLRRACDLWNDGEKAIAHIHLAHAGLPPCGTDQALRFFVAEELIDAGVTPETLMKAQGFDPPLDLWKAHFNPDQPRVPPGSGRESGEWTDGEATFTPVAFRSRRGRRGHRGGGGWLDAIRSFLESLGERPKPQVGEHAPEEKPPNPEVVKPKTKPPDAPETENLQLPEVDANKLHHIFDKPRHGLDGLVTEFGSQESAFQAVASATRDGNYVLD